MRQNSNGKTRDIISMEEYLKKSQAIKSKENAVRADLNTGLMTALKLAELLYV